MFGIKIHQQIPCMACLLIICYLLPADCRAQWTTIPVNKSGKLIADKAYTLFTLTQDILAEASGLEILPASGVTDIVIDLNGHTLSFANSTSDMPEGKTMLSYNGMVPSQKNPSRNVGHFGIFFTRDPRLAPHGEHFSTNRWLAPLKRLSIISSRPGGRIIQGNGGASYGAGILLNGVENVWIAGSGKAGEKYLTIEVNGPDFYGINTAGSISVKISDVIVVHKGRHVSNRHAIVAAVTLGPGQVPDDKQTDSVSEARNVDVIGSPQSGIVVRSHSRVTGCRISQDVTVTNGYGVQGWKADGVEVFDNVIEPAWGRGIHLSEGSSNWNVHDNIVKVKERAVAEYPNGYLTHGIKLENTSNSRVYGNLVLVRTGPKTSAHALDMTLQKDAGNVVWGNTFIALNQDFPRETKAISVVMRSNGGGNEISGNRFISNELLVSPGVDETEHYTLQGNVFQRINSPHSPEPFRAVSFNAWRCSQTSILLLNNVFEGGTSFKDAWINTDNAIRNEFSVCNSIELLIIDEWGNPFPGAIVIATDRKGGIREAVADKSGVAKMTLDAAAYLYDSKAPGAMTLIKSPTAPFPGTFFTPHKVTVSSQGLQAASFTTEMDRPRRFIIRLGPAPDIKEETVSLDGVPSVPDLRKLEQ